MSEQQSQEKLVRSAIGRVISDARDKTIAVLIEGQRAHPQYKKIVKFHQKFHAHDEENAAKMGDVVEIAQCRPVSKTKTWRLVKIMSSA